MTSVELRASTEVDTRVRASGASCQIVLPCFNEEACLQLLLEEIHQSLKGKISYGIIAVNDGSTDSTSKILEAYRRHLPIDVLNHNNNRGLGAALRTGLLRAVEKGAPDDVVVTMDADLTHDPKDILRMIEKVRIGSSLVIGSRYCKNGAQMGVPLRRVFMSRCLNLILRFGMNMAVRDATSGFRCYRVHELRQSALALQRRFVMSDGFDAPFELLVEALPFQSLVSEIPITLDYSRKLSSSKMSVNRTVYRYIRLIPKAFRWRMGTLRADSHPLQSSL